MMSKHRAEGAPLVPLEVRRWIYLVATAVVPLLVAYGLLSSDQAPLWLALVGAIVGGVPSVVASLNVRDPEPVE